MKLIQFMNKKKLFRTNQPDALAEVTVFVEETLTSLGIDRKLVIRTMLLAEETSALVIENAEPDSQLVVQVKKYLGDAVVTIRADGRELNLIDSSVGSLGTDSEDEDEETQRAIRSILLKSQEDKLRYTHKNGVNHVRILAGQGERSLLFRTLTALALGTIFGALMLLVFPDRLSEGMITYILSPVQDMFMNSLKTIIGPAVFFTIVTCFRQFKDLSELGRIGAKVLATYLATTVFAVLIGAGVFMLLKPGAWGFALTSGVPAESVAIDTDVDASFLSTIVNLVPSNFVQPFVESNTSQIIFLAVLCGIAAGMIERYSSALMEIFEACDALFLMITTILSGFIPLTVFCSSALTIKQLGGKALLEVLDMGSTSILAIFCILVVYGIMIALIARLNPFTFYKKNREGMKTGFTLSSSSAAMPTNMRTCTDKLGISPKICGFSIPLGAIINLDGACILLVIISLFLARAYGVAVSRSLMISVGVTIILLSLGTPGVPGSTIVCAGVVLQRLGVPVEAIALVMGILPFLEMFTTMSNTTGDVAAAVIVAKSEGLLDESVYNANL